MKIRTSNRCRQLLRGSASCYLCQATEYLQVHHLNWQHSDDTPSNLLIVCQRCHTELHKAGYLTAQELESIRTKIDLERTIQGFQLDDMYEGEELDEEYAGLFQEGL